MKLRERLLVMALLPVICLGVLVYLGSSGQTRQGLEDQAFEGLQTTVLTIREMFDSLSEGEFYLDEEGQLWKGEELNISASTEFVDSVKNNTGYEVTVFYGDERILTTLMDSSGKRQVGTKASEAVSSQVLNQGKVYESDNTEIFGKRYMCCYVPLYQSSSQTPVGMLFIGKEYETVEAAIRSSLLTLLGIILVVLVIVCITSVLSATRIGSAIKGAIVYVDQLGQGKLGVEAPAKIIGRKDEIGDMCRSVKKLDDNLVSIINEIQVQTEILGETSAMCNQNIHKTLNSAEQINAAAEEVAAATTAQAQGAQEAESSVNEMGRTVEEANGQIQEFSDTSHEMAKASESAKRALAELNQSMNQVKREVDRVYHQTNETHVSVEKIGEMTDVITSIASQTNLLSLNASIEAARAGEMGKGFAVVAEEIRKLAEQCSTSAVEIQEVLTQLKNNSDESVEIMGEVQKIILSQADKLSETNVVFESVGEGIDRSMQGLGKIIDEMGSLNGERDRTVAEVQNVATLAQQNAASIEETAASIDEMVRLVSAVSERIDNLTQVSDILQEKASVFQLS